jgi:hypothetical protein
MVLTNCPAGGDSSEISLDPAGSGFLGLTDPTHLVISEFQYLRLVTVTPTGLTCESLLPTIGAGNELQQSNSLLMRNM